MKYFHQSKKLFCLSILFLAACSNGDNQDGNSKKPLHYTPGEIGYETLANFSDVRLAEDMIAWGKSGIKFQEKDEYESQDEFKQRWQAYFVAEREAFGAPVAVYVNLGEVGNKNSRYGLSAISVDFDPNEKKATFSYDPKYFTRVLDVGLAPSNDENNPKTFSANYHSLTDLKCLSLDNASSFKSTHIRHDIPVGTEQARNLDLLGKPKIYVAARVLMDPASKLLDGAQFQKLILPENKKYTFETDKKSGFLTTYPRGVFGNSSYESEILPSSKTPNILSIGRYRGYGDVTDIMVVDASTHNTLFTLPSCTQG